MPLLRSFALALWLLYGLCLGAGAQSMEEPAPGQVSSTGRPAGERSTPHTANVSEVKPDTYWLPDEDGRLQPMLGWTFEDFLRVWKSGEAAPPLVEEPAFSLQRLECTGRIENDDFAHLQVRAEIRLHTDNRVAVPLAFPSGILTAFTTDSPEGDAYIQFDEELGEHVLWTSGTSGSSREVQLELLLPVTQRGKQRVLKFHSPRAAISELTLTLPGKGIVAESLTPGIQVSSTTKDDHTIVEARGLTATTEIAWRAAGDGEQQTAQFLVADSEVQVRAGQSGLSTEVTLAVQDLHGTMDRFLIRLPAGHRLVSHQVQWATLQPVDDASATDAPPGGDRTEATAVPSTYEVRLTEPQQTPLRLTLTLERSLGLQEDEEQVLLRGVEVVGAVRQQGRLHLSVGDDLRVRWQEGQRIQQIATPAEMEGAADGDITASFEFDAEDWNLPLALALRPTEISVVPSYRLDIGREGVRLETTFRYSVRGTKQFDLRFALGPWELIEDPQGPDTTISAENTYIDDAGTMYLPLANPAEGTFQATLKLKLPDWAPSGPLQFRLPECLDGRVQDGELTVAVERSLDVIPQAEALLGLTPATRPSPTAAPPEPLERTSQRYLVTSLPAEYAAVVRPRTRTVRNETRLNVSAYADHVLIQEEIHLDVRHLPINDVALQVPLAMAHHSAVEYEVEGEAVVPGFEDPPPGSNSGGGRIARLLLDQPHLGGLTVTVRFQMPWPSPAERNSSPRELVVPIAIPEADSHHISATLINYTNNLQVQFPNRANGSSEATAPVNPVVNPGDRSRMELARPAQSLTITAKGAPTTSQNALVVERTWIQSVVGGDVVRTRTAMRFVPISREIVLDLGPAELEYVLLNGQFVSPLRVSDEEMAVRMDELPPGEPCVLEIIQRGRFDQRAGGKLHVVPPRVEEARGHGLVYWQLFVPRRLHAFGAGDELASASPWSLDGIYWVRTPLLSQADLEDFIGLSGPSPPTGAFNELLFSGVELPEVLEVSLIRRSLVVLFTSGVILAIALAVLYVPLLQRKELAVVAVVGVAIAGAMYPNVAPFIVQSGALGIVLTLIAVFLKRLAGHWHWTPSRSPADTAVYRQETPGSAVQGALPPSEATSSARTFVPVLSDPGAHHSA